MRIQFVLKRYFSTLAGLRNALPSVFYAHADSSSISLIRGQRAVSTNCQKLLEQRRRNIPLNTRDRHALCYAYSKTKHYTKVVAGLDKLART